MPRFNTSPSSEQRATAGTLLRTLFVAAGLNSPAVSAGDVEEVEVVDGPVRREGKAGDDPDPKITRPTSVWIRQQGSCS